MLNDDGVFESKVGWLLEESLSDLVVVAASDEAVANEFELNGTIFTKGGQSLELCVEVEDVFAWLLRTAVKFGARVDDRSAV